MKNLCKYTLAVFFGSMALMSCSEDNLDIVQKGVTGLDTYKTADDATVISMIGAVYTKFRGDYSSSSSSFGGDGTTSYVLFNSDICKMTDEDADSFRYQDGPDGEVYPRTWSYFYTICYWCNMLIENLPDNTVASETVKNRVLAEAHGMRAIAMSYLVQFFGNAPLADHIMQGNEGNTPAAESWTWIEKEFDIAIAGLPSKADKEGQKAIGGRLTREACYAFKGRAQLWQGKYAEAAATLDEVISSNLYELIPNFDGLNVGSTSDFCPENIFEFNFDDSDAMLSGQETKMDIYAMHTTPLMFYGAMRLPLLYMNWGTCASPTQNLYNAFVAHDGAQGPRLAACIMTSADPEVQYCSNYASALPIQNNQGYFRLRDLCRIEDKVGTFPLEFTKRNTVYMRYAEVLLNYAEAVCKGGAECSISGLEALNLVRRRAGLEDAPALDMDDATYGIKAERRFELYHEGARYIDCVRWGDAAKVFANVGKDKFSFNGEGEPGNYTYTTDPLGGPGWKEGKNELFPIPSSDVNGNPNLKQNSGW